MPIKPMWALLVILFYGALLGGSVWSGSQWKELQAPDMITVDQQGRLYVRIYNTIQQFSQQGVWQREYLLEKIGVHTKHSIGGLGVFTNGDLLLLQGEPGRSAEDNLQRFNRSENTESYQHDPAAPQLTRCNSELTQCKPLENFSRKFKNTFNVYIDDQDNIFLADTAGHAVYWLDSSGKEIASLKSDLKYPNNLRRIGDTLWVVNTNHHELMAIDISKHNFGDIKKISILNDTTDREKEIWPSAAEKTDKYWFVLNNETGMDKGALYQYDLSGNFIKRLDTPGVDPIAIGKTDKELWMADFKHIQVLRFDFEGNYLGILNDEHLEKLVGQSRDIINKYSLLENILWYGFWVCLVLGMAIAVMLDRHYRKQHPEQFNKDSKLENVIIDESISKPDPNLSYIQWVQPNIVKFNKLLIASLCACFISMIIFIYLTEIGRKMVTDLHIMGMFGGLLFACLVGFYGIRILMRARIAVYGPWLLIKNYKNKIKIAKDKDIKYTANVIVIEDMFMPYKDGYGRPIWDKEWLETKLMPVLVRGQKWSQKDYLQWQWRYQRSLLIISVLGIMVLLAVVIVDKLKL